MRGLVIAVALAIPAFASSAVLSSAGALAQPPHSDVSLGGGRNALLNPSFERGLRGWTPLNPTSTIADVGASAKFGNRAALVRSGASSPYGIDLTTAIGDPSQDARYTLSVWARSRTASSRGRRVVIEILEAGGTIGPSVVGRATAVLETKWRKVEARGYVRGAGRWVLSVRVLRQKNVTSSEAFLIDGAVLTFDGYRR